MERFGICALLVGLAKEVVTNEVSVGESLATAVEGFEDHLSVICGLQVDLDNLHVSSQRSDQRLHPLTGGVVRIIQRVIHVTDI
jgi:hypothetical protein